MSGILGWIISIVLVLFWTLPVALLIWVIWQVARRLTRREESRG